MAKALGTKKLPEKSSTGCRRWASLVIVSLSGQDVCTGMGRLQRPSKPNKHLEADRDSPAGSLCHPWVDVLGACRNLGPSRRPPHSLGSHLRGKSWPEPEPCAKAGRKEAGEKYPDSFSPQW